MIALGVLVAVVVAQRRWQSWGGDEDDIVTVAVWAVPAGLIGARLYHVITDWNRLYDDGRWTDAFLIWRGGLGIPGGVLVGAIVGVIVARRTVPSWRRLADAAAPALPIAQAIGRLGNYFNQELYGRATDLPWGLQVDPGFRPKDSAYLGVSTYHPTFLYEGLWNLALAGLIIWGGTKVVFKPGRWFAVYICWLRAGPPVGGVVAHRHRVAHPGGPREHLDVADDHSRRSDLAPVGWWTRQQRGNRSGSGRGSPRRRYSAPRRPSRRRRSAGTPPWRGTPRQRKDQITRRCPRGQTAPIPMEHRIPMKLPTPMKVPTTMMLSIGRFPSQGSAATASLTPSENPGHAATDHSPNSRSLSATHPTPVPGSTHKRVPLPPKWPNVADSAVDPVQCGDLMPLISGP